jgi:hypothetical protein
MPAVLQVAFRWDEDEAAVHAASIDEARHLAARTEFEWKLILRDPATRTSGAVYLFADRAGAQAWLDELHARRGRDIEARIFEVNEEASLITRAPLGQAGAASIPVERLNASNDE